ncbi:sodium:proton antiporter NhaD [Dongia rigui]|uniref:Sodium:proton antiporter NhaD n=1 Tax=Dongia rigui TaxID=940149 RepID=A0ABU5DVE2_9PROT|nr:sodium:proton antiporter NhaD [Dongia rigui]MDY0871254.1 sodium:proton antiporter NhaD [Dongia rigui]
MDLTTHWSGLAVLFIFAAAYFLVICEEVIEMRKSKPVLVAAGLIWALVAIGYDAAGAAEAAHVAVNQIILEYGELLLFLLVAITYVNTLEERRVFDVLRARLVALGLGYRALFWLTGAIAFPLSAVLDNLTTALVMGAVVLAVGAGSRAFIALGCINIVVAANAGGAFSPFGDITTLMVWQAGKLGFWDFFDLFLPSLVNWLVPAALMHFALPPGKPAPRQERVRPKPGSIGVILLFAATIATAVAFKNFLHLPPAIGMMLGLGYLQIWAYYLNRLGKRRDNSDMLLDSFKEIQRVEFDTLLFFFGIIFAVGGLGAMGYLAVTSKILYAGLGPTTANIVIGALSAIVDNIPLMFAVLKMDPAMTNGQWLLVTLTCGVGGSILSIGSAAGVALMGQARGSYTFFAHLKWSWAVAAGYGASILVHRFVNAALF